MGICKRLRKARKEVGLSQQALGQILGVTKSAVSHWESPHKPTTLTFNNLFKAAQATQVATEWLATGRTLDQFILLRQEDSLGVQQGGRPGYDEYKAVMHEGDEYEWLRLYEKIPNSTRRFLLEFIGASFSIPLLPGQEPEEPATD